MIGKKTIGYAAISIALAGFWCGTANRAIADPNDTTTTTVITTHYPRMQMPDNHIRVIIDDQPVRFYGHGPIMMDGGHVFVPIRGVFEKMGGDVEWDPSNQAVNGSKPGHMFRITIGSQDALVNGDQQTLSTPPVLIDGTTYVPLRFASEALGAHVHWHADTNTVSISERSDDDGGN